MHAWSIIVALETCLCPKSYLLGSWIRSSWISVDKGWVGGDGAGDLPRRSLVDGTRRVIPDVRTEDGGTSGELLRVRHLW